MAQKALHDSSTFKEGIAVGEIGGVSSTSLKGGKSNFGYSGAVEATLIEHWLEIEFGASSTLASHYKETDIDFILKKPWSFSSKLEFMLGIGPEWAHLTEFGTTTNTWNGEIALDFMYWPFKKRQFGFYAEPAYVYGFKETCEQSVELSIGVLTNIP